MDRTANETNVWRIQCDRLAVDAVDEMNNFCFRSSAEANGTRRKVLSGSINQEARFARTEPNRKRPAPAGVTFLAAACELSLGLRAAVNTLAQINLVPLLEFASISS